MHDLTAFLEFIFDSNLFTSIVLMVKITVTYNLSIKVIQMYGSLFS